MHHLVLPYFYRSKKQDYFLHLHEQELVLIRRPRQDVWREGSVIATKCRCFRAAPDQDGRLHVLAADDKNNLCYLLVDEDSVREAPFIVKESQGPFLLAFSAAGHGYFCGSQLGHLVQASFSSERGWVKMEFTTVLETACPAGLAMDRHGGSHLLLYDTKRHTLTYQYHSPTQNSCAKPLTITSALPSEAIPVISLDINQAVHIAWYDARNQTVNYRKKAAGGWPIGGWQPEQSLKISFLPQLLGFFEKGQVLQLWVTEASGRLHAYNQQDAGWQQVENETRAWHPLQIGTLGMNALNFTASLPPGDWCFADENVAHNNPEHPDDGNLLLIHARRLVEERQLLESRLHKKETSLTQLRQMLERSQESQHKQHHRWDEQIRQLGEKAQRLTENLKNREAELATINAQSEQLQNKITHAETEKRKYQAELISLRSKLSESQALVLELQAKIKEQEPELARPKRLWEKISEFVQKNPTDKN